MKLTRSMKRVLNRIIEDEKNCPHCIKIETIDYPYFFALYGESIYVDSVLKELEKQGALTIVDRNEWVVELTEAGRHYKEFIRQQWRDFMFKSVFAPILVACVTSAITAVVTAVITAVATTKLLVGL